MKKIISLILVGIMMTTMLVACGNDESQGNDDVSLEVDVDKVADEILTVMNFEDDMIVFDNKKLEYYYSSIDLSDLVKYKVYYASSSAKAEEIAVFEAIDEDAASRIKAAAEERNSDLLFGFEDYEPEEYSVAENAYIAVKGKYIFYIVGKNVDQGKKIVEENTFK